MAQTLCALRGTCKVLAECFAPTNQAMWQELVLRHHSFDTTGDKFEAEFMREATTYLDFDQAKCYFADREVAKEAIRLRGWPQIGVAFRPSQYGFLERIQLGEQPRSEWPVNEDAYTLYKDLFFLITSVGPVNSSMTFGEGSNCGAPVLLSNEDGADVGYCVGLSEDPRRADAATAPSRLLYSDKSPFNDDDCLKDMIQEEDEEDEEEEEDADERNDSGVEKSEKKRLFRLRLIDRIDATIAAQGITNNEGSSGTTPYFQIGKRIDGATNPQPDRRRWLGVAVVLTYT